MSNWDKMYQQAYQKGVDFALRYLQIKWFIIMPVIFFFIGLYIGYKL